MNEFERQWIAKAAINKDPRYFGYLVKEHQSTVRGYLRRLTKGNEALADDLSQETFMTAFRKISYYKATGSFISWLLSIAYRSFLMHLRVQKTNPLNEASEAELLTENLQETSHLDVKIDLEKALSMLNENERSTLTLNFSFGMSHREVSEIMNMPLGTVKSHITRGKEKLKTLLLPQNKNPLQHEKVRQPHGR